jgi:hypothetical protein
MATAVMDTDHMEHTNHMRRHLDLERIGHMCVHTVPGGGDVTSATSVLQLTTEECGIHHMRN